MASACRWAQALRGWALCWMAGRLTGRDFGSTAAASQLLSGVRLSASPDFHRLPYVCCCPAALLSLSRLQTPARFAGASGLQAFDLDSFLSMAQRNRKWQDPTTMANSSVEQLQVGFHHREKHAPATGPALVASIILSPCPAHNGSSCTRRTLTHLLPGCLSPAGGCLHAAGG